MFEAGVHVYMSQHILGIEGEGVYSERSKVKQEQSDMKETRRAETTRSKPEAKRTSGHREHEFKTIFELYFWTTLSNNLTHFEKFGKYARSFNNMCKKLTNL